MLENRTPRIGACIMVHNMAPFIGACVRSLRWTDGIFVFDDHSTDNSLEIAFRSASVEVRSERSRKGDVAFRDSELETRNYIIQRAFQELALDALIVMDADELLSSLVRPKIFEMVSNPVADALAFSTWHLYDERRYLHFWELKVNGVVLIDPHVRVVKTGSRFEAQFGDGSHPAIHPTKHTFAKTGPYHFHLKYFKYSTLPNYSLFFQRWSRNPGQNGGLAKVDSGFGYAANFSSFACVA